MRLLKVTTPVLGLVFLLGACAEGPGTPAEAAVPVAMAAASAPTPPVQMAAVEVVNCSLDQRGEDFFNAWMRGWFPAPGKTAFSQAQGKNLSRGEAAQFAVAQLAQQGVGPGNGTMGQLVVWLQNGAPTSNVPAKVQACL
jgi:hypothetical protein